MTITEQEHGSPDLALTIIAAAWGLTVGLASQPLFMRPARPGQAVGYMLRQNLDAHGPMRHMLAIILCSLVMAAVIPRIAARIRNDDAGSWPRRAIASSLLIAIWSWTVTHEMLWPMSFAAGVILMTVICRRLALRFTRADLVLLPTFIVTYFAALDIAPHFPSMALFLISILIVGAARIAAALSMNRLRVPVATAFALSPLGLTLQTALSGMKQRHDPVGPLLIAFGSPIVIILLASRNPRFARRMRTLRIVTLLVYPLFALALNMAASSWVPESHARINFFEAGHSLEPASEMLRGERPYRDFVPGHGFIEDGYLDYLSMKFGSPDLGHVMKTREVISGLSAVSIYAATAAATGDSGAGMLAMLLSHTFFSGGFLRVALPMFAVALACLAVRRRRARPLFFAAVCAGFSFWISLDFATYSVLAVLFALGILVAPSRRWHLLWQVPAGFVLGGLPVLLYMAARGVAIDALRVTLTEIATLGPNYSIGFYSLPNSLESLHVFPDILLGLPLMDSFAYAGWATALLFVAAQLGWRHRRQRSTLALAVLAVFTLAAVISYAERHHPYAIFGAFALSVAGTAILFRSPSRTARGLGYAAAFALIVAAHPTDQFGFKTLLRLARGKLDPNVHEVMDPPRARGAYLNSVDVAVLRVVNDFVKQDLAKDETFFDFTNKGILYYLTERDCPVREFETGFYQSRERQLDIIRALQNNPRVKAALIPSRPEYDHIDHITNAERAPLVWKYLQDNFTEKVNHPYLKIWVRKPLT